MLIHLNNLAQFTHDHVLPLCINHNIFTFTGPLGAGKTTLVRELLRQQGIQEPITSPTFGYLKSYQAPNNIMHHHFDLYRIKSIEDFMAAGFDEYVLHKKNISYIEWPEIIDQLLKQPTLISGTVDITLSYHPTDQHMREIQINVHE